MEEQNQNSAMGGTISQVSEFPQKPSVKPKSKKKVLIGIAIGLIVIIIGIGVVFATGIWDPVWNPLRPSPNKIIKEALENMSKLESVRTKFTVNFDVPSSSGEKAEGKMVFDIFENNSDPENPKSKILVDLSIVQKGLEVLFGGEIRVVDKVFYLNITTVPLVLRIQLAATGINLDPFIGKWLRFDPKEAGLSLEAMTMDEQASQELTNEILGLFEKYPVFKTKAKLPNEKINNNQAYHFLLTVDKENAKKFILGVRDIVRTKLGSLISEPLSADEDQSVAQLDNFFDKAGEIEFEIWIGTKDKYIYKIKTDKNVYALSADDTQTGGMALGFEMAFSEFNQTQEISAPEKSDNLIELLMPFFQIWMMGGGTSTNEFNHIA
ncbi:MAG: hypothetical protein NTY11_02940 [Candidatus Parcubacteria bacterium]|nr:hypothetical protein [Candidatus Parcubacteria bacterium]